MNQSKSRFRAAVLLSSLAIFAAVTEPARSDTAYFTDKTVTFIVATKPGGGYDTYGRLIAKYLEKHLPGSQFLVRNIPGAGHIVGANQLYAAEPNGLTIGMFNTGLIYAQLLQREGIRFDLNRMSWIGKAASEPRVMMVGADTGFASIGDLRNSAEPVLLASSGVGTASHNEMSLLADALNIKVKIVPGFSGNEGQMSIMRGEVAGTFGSLSSLRPFVENGFGRFLLHVGGGPELGSAIPAARDLVTDPEGRAIVALIQSQTELGRLTAGPPGIPANRLAALRAAYQAALEDPELLAEANRIRIPIVPMFGDELSARIGVALDQPPSTVVKLARVVNIKPPSITVRAPLQSVENAGKSISFQAGGKIVRSKISGSRTRIAIDGRDQARDALRQGMICSVEYSPGSENEAIVVDCDR